MASRGNHGYSKLAGVIAAMAVVNLVYGISFPLLALVLDQLGTSRTLIGLNTVVQAAAIFAVAPLAPYLLQRFDGARLMQACALGLALLFLIAGLYVNVWFWFPLRFLIGSLTALLWITSEALINHLAGDRHRGRIISLYSALGSAGFALGPMLLALTGSQGMLPFGATILTLMLAAVPLWFSRDAGRIASDSRGSGVWAAFRLAPVIMLANVAYAAAVESLITFFPLFGMHLGLTEPYSLSLMTALAVGGMVLILPLGWLADHVSRMAMLAACSSLAGLGLLLMAWPLQAGPVPAFTFIFLLGGVEGMIYTLGVILIGQQFRGASLAAATTAFTVSWGAGTIVGPLAVGLAMDFFGNAALAWVTAAFFLCFAPLPLLAWRRERRARAAQGSV